MIKNRVKVAIFPKNLFFDFQNYFSRNMPTFERDEEAHRQHLAHLEEIEQALDAEFGTVGSAADDDEATADGGGNGTSAGDENSANVGRSGGGGAANKFRCIVCEKNFNTKSVSVRRVEIFYTYN